MQQQQQETSDSIEVLIRIRPFSEREKLEEARSCFKIDSHSKNTLIFEATTKSEAKYFTFDHVCTEHINQEEIFRIIGIPTASSCLQGKNLFSKETFGISIVLLFVLCSNLF